MNNPEDANMAIGYSADIRSSSHGPLIERTIKALIDGKWHGALPETPDVRLSLKNSGDGFHHKIGTQAASAFPARPNRYHLYVSYACPWAHRTIIYRKLKALKNVVSMSVLHPRWAGPGGWYFADDQRSTIDHCGGRRYLYEVYQAAQRDYTGRVTVPVLWDRKKETIVNNQSGEIIRILNTAFDSWGDTSVDFYPADLRSEIDALNAWLIPSICAAVYKVGFASNQAIYDQAIVSLFEALDEVEKRLSRQPCLLGRRITESDWHLFATLCRFDAVYFGAMKCNLRRLIDYPALCDYTRRIYQLPGVADTVRFDHIKQHYYDAIGEIDPTIVPHGPQSDYRNTRGPGVDAEGTGSDRHETSPDLFLKEVHSLHEYLEHWMKGEVSDQKRGPLRLENALADDFLVIHPGGNREGKSDVIRNFARAYGEKSADYALQIKDPSVRMLADGVALVTYTESHRGEPGRTRLSSALLRQRPDRESLQWLFLQETYASGSGTDRHG
ncbi:MAG: DUF4440 domain-containing protein [Gammaproteobacteria bacterium]|nr:DUF4440 domain-containing protein [Gammaproteobacteria bacterium]